MAEFRMPITLSKKAVLLLSGTLAGITVLALNPHSSDAATQNAIADAQSNTIVAPHPGFADMIASVRSAVVNISTANGTSGPRIQGNLPEQFDGPELDEFMRRFFGAPGADTLRPKRESNRQRRALGSGFIVDASGFVVTNRHVVDGADEITVILDDGTELAATVTGVDDKTDLALLKVDSESDLPFVTFETNDSTRVGDWVVAIGNPFGLGGTATTGIVSARGRDINSGPLDDYIQIDAPINTGNSGGPLFNSTGNVIGVNTAIFSPNGGSVGIGFAIPADQADRVVASLKEHGYVARGYLGVHIQQMDDELAKALGLETSEGALVTDVMSDSPAERGGLKEGDVIISFADETIETMRELPHVVAKQMEEAVPVEVIRDQKSMTLTVTPEVSTKDATVAAVGEAEESAEGAKLGITAAPLDETMRERAGLDADTNGVVVADVDNDGPSAGRGIRPGDVITAVGGKSIDSIPELKKQVDQAASNGGTVLLKVLRNGNARFVAVPVA